MARPRADEPGFPAKTRIEEAFWSLLNKMPYSEISIKKLASEANVNHKSIYYYYDNIDAMARQLFEENISENFSTNNPMLSMLNGHPEEFTDSQINTEGAKRVLLYCRSDSAFLNAIFKECIRKNWLASIGLSEDNLTEDEDTDLEFIFSGMVSLLGKDFSSYNIKKAIRIFDRDLGKAVKSTFLRLASK